MARSSVHTIPGIPIRGTSEGSPQWAGIIADANQLAGRPLGFINPALYRLGANSATASSSYHDITVGNNAYQSVTPVPGYDATPGWDLATGWGSPRVATLLPQLIALCDDSARAKALYCHW